MLIFVDIFSKSKQCPCRVHFVKILMVEEGCCLQKLWGIQKYEGGDEDHL